MIDRNIRVVKCAYLNARSAAKRGAIDSLRMYCLAENIDILFLVESWFDSKVTDAELSFNGTYQVFRYDRPKRGGGVCILVLNSINASRVDLRSSCEYVAIDITSPLETLRLICFYVTNSGDSSARTERIEECCRTITRCRATDHPVITVGDFPQTRIIPPQAQPDRRLTLLRLPLLDWLDRSFSENCQAARNTERHTTSP